MRKKVIFAAGFVMVAMMSAMVFAAQNSNAPAVRQQAKQPESLVDQATTSSQPAPGKTGLSKRNKAKPVLSKRNKAMMEEAEQRKLRQIQIDKERAADPQPK
jgi:hypothetical protein